MSLSDIETKIADLDRAKATLANQIHEKANAALKRIAEAGFFIPCISKKPGAGYYFAGEYEIDGDKFIYNYEWSSSGETDKESITFPLALIENPTPEAIAAFIKGEVDKVEAEKRAKHEKYLRDKFRDAKNALIGCHVDRPDLFPALPEVFDAAPAPKV